MDAPAYLCNLLELELYRVQKSLLQDVATKYNLPYEELVQEFLASPLRMVPNKSISIVVKKKIDPKPAPPDDHRCHARVWNRGRGGQCTRPHKPENEYCAQHLVHRKHGDVRDKPDRTVFSGHAHALYK